MNWIRFLGTEAKVVFILVVALSVLEKPEKRLTDFSLELAM